MCSVFESSRECSRGLGTSCALGEWCGCDGKSGLSLLCWSQETFSFTYYNSIEQQFSIFHSLLGNTGILYLHTDSFHVPFLYFESINLLIFKNLTVQDYTEYVFSFPQSHSLEVADVYNLAISSQASLYTAVGTHMCTHTHTHTRINTYGIFFKNWILFYIKGCPVIFFSYNIMAMFLCQHIPLFLFLVAPCRFWYACLQGSPHPTPPPSLPL